MKTTRRVSALATAIILSFTLSVSAGPRDPQDRGRDLPAKIVKIIQKIFGITTQDDLPIPPKP